MLKETNFKALLRKDAVKTLLNESNLQLAQ